MDPYYGGDKLIHIESNEDHSSNVSQTDNEDSSILKNDRLFKMLSWEIFTWLPEKSIVKFSSTLKECTKFIQEELFCKKQQQNMKLMEDCGILIQPDIPYSFYSHINTTKFFPLPDKNLRMSLPPKSMMFLNKVEVFASSGGLLFCVSLETDPIEPFLILNPATQMMTRVPGPSGFSFPVRYTRDLKTLFSYDENDNFHLMMIIPFSYDNDDVRKYKCLVYFPKENVWREKSQQGFTLGTRSLSLESHVFFDGCVYLLSDFYGYPWNRRDEDYFPSPYIVCYDINDEKTRFFSLPKRARRGRNHITCRMKIFPWNKSQTMCLVKIRKDLFTVWAWNKDSEKWTQILRKKFSEMGLLYYEEFDIVTFEVISGKTMVIIMRDDKIYSYKLVRDVSDQDEDGEQKVSLIVQRDGDFEQNLVLYAYSNTLRQFPNSYPIS